MCDGSITQFVSEAVRDMLAPLLPATAVLQCTIYTVGQSVRLSLEVDAQGYHPHDTIQFSQDAQIAVVGETIVEASADIVAVVDAAITTLVAATDARNDLTAPSRIPNLYWLSDNPVILSLN